MQDLKDKKPRRWLGTNIHKVQLAFDSGTQLRHDVTGVIEQLITRNRLKKKSIPTRPRGMPTPPTFLVPWMKPGRKATPVSGKF